MAPVSLRIEANASHGGVDVVRQRIEQNAPEILADAITALRPKLAKKNRPFTLPTVPGELLWPLATDDDDGCRFVRAKIDEIVTRRPR
jgi:hypothetical protein